MWIDTVTHLNDVQIIVPDLLGFGQSSRASEEYLSLPRQAEHVRELLKGLGIERAHIVGHDLGGGIAQIMAVRYPELVQSLVVIDGVCFSNWPLPKVVSLRYPTLPESNNPALFVETMLREGMYYQPLVTPELLERFMLPYRTPNAMNQLQQCSLALEHHQTAEIVPLLANLRIPATFLYGEYDRFLPAYWGTRLQATVPGSTFRLIPYAGHYSMLDQPGIVATELLSHLQRATSGVLVGS
ncbi:alpha/beta hydrolase [Paenibacillus sp. TRM 82003]|nr:alpha/beta hydrolase [Paenibacillus sp. TRM 82003]